MTAKITIVDLEWSEPAPPNERCHYDHVIAETPFGKVTIEWKGWKSYPGYTAETPWGYFASENTLEDCKDAVKLDLEQRVRSVVEVAR